MQQDKDNTHGAAGDADYQASLDELHKAQQEYDTHWPMHCHVCNGWGSVEVGTLFGPVEVTSEACSTCVTRGFCPRCGKGTLQEKRGCTTCQWTIADGGRPTL